eukprot:1870525-Alexandrium_andersonii.AAC.1
MSASLVGSEMCIRDRSSPACPAAWASPSRRPPGRRPGAARPAAPVGSRSVSYTHLTLPTICSV